MTILLLRRFAAGLALLVIAAPSLAQSLVPVKDFARKTDLISAKISPLGNYLAVAKRGGGQVAVGVFDLATMKMTAVMAFTRGDLPADYYWVGPARLVAEVAKSNGPLDQPRLTGELFGMNADGSNRQYLFGHRGRETVGSHVKRGAGIEYAWAFMVDPLPEDPLHALIEVRPWGKHFADTLPSIERINVNTADRKRIAQLPLFNPTVLAGEDGQPRFVAGSLQDATCCELRAWAPEAKDWVTVDHPGGRPGYVHLHGMNSAGTSVFLSSSERGAPACLREYRFEDKSLTTLHCHPTVDPFVGHLANLDKGPAVIHYEDGLPQVVYPDPEHPDARLMRSLQRSFPGQRISGLSQTLDRSKAVILVDSDRNPGDFYLLNRTAKKVEYLMARGGWIDPAKMAPVAPIRVETRDGLAVHGYLTAKDGLKAKKTPMVVMPHGGPHGIRDYWEWNPDAQLLASRGYAVLQVNYRGSGGYGTGFEVAGHRKWGAQMQDDLTDAVRWTIAQGIADPARVCICGGSYGGYAALMSATREPDLYKCAVGLAGVYDLVEQVEESDTAGYSLGRAALERVLGSDEEALRAQSPVTHIANLKAAVLIAHGTSDQRVPFSQAKLLRRALEKHDKPFEWLEFSGEEHGFYKDENQEKFYNKLLEFLEKHIGPNLAAEDKKGTH